MRRLSRANKLLRATASVTLVIILSKLFGFIRDMVTAGYFGTSMENDAYVSAYSLFYLPVLLLNSCITSTVVPLYVEARQTRGNRRANRFGSNATNLFAVASLVIGALVYALADPLVRIIYPGFDEEKLLLTARLTRIMMLTLVFNVTSISLSSLLNAREKYVSAQLTGFPLNFAIVLATVLFSSRYGIEAVAWGVFAANILQTLVLIPALAGWFRYTPVLDFHDRRLQRLIAMALPAMFSMAVSELNHMIDRMLASGLNTGDITAMNYAYRLITFMTGILIVPLTTIMFSRMSKSAVGHDRRGMLRDLRRSVVLIVLVMLPIVAIAAVMNEDVIRLAFMRGKFDAQSVQVTAGVFLFYVLGVVGFGLRDLLNRTFHALRDTKTTMYVSIGVVIANIVLNLILRKWMGVNGLALATTIAGTGGMLCLFGMLRRKIGLLGFRRVLPDLLKIAFSTAATIVLALCMNRALPAATGTLSVFCRLAAVTAACGIFYLSLCYLTGVSLIRGLLNGRRIGNGRGTADNDGLPRGGRTGGGVAPSPHAVGVLRAGKAQKEPERVYAGRHRPARTSGSSAAVRSSRSGQDHARRDHRRRNGAQHPRHQRPRD